MRSLALVIALALALPLAAAAPADAAVWSTTAHHGQHSFGAYVIRNNMWNCPCGYQRIWANSHRSWGVRSHQAGTAIRTYPSAQRVFTMPNGNPLPLSRLRSLTSWFREQGPTGHGHWEWAYDVWLNDYRTEVMIWTDTTSQRPAGQQIRKATIAGRRWSLWADGGRRNVDGIYTLRAVHNFRHGRVRILKLLHWLGRHGWLPAQRGLSAVEGGWEIASSGGRARSWHVSAYSVRSRRR